METKRPITPKHQKKIFLRDFPSGPVVVKTALLKQGEQVQSLIGEMRSPHVVPYGHKFFKKLKLNF